MNRPGRPGTATASPAPADGSAPPAPGRSWLSRLRAVLTSRPVKHIGLLAIYIGLGILVTWPRATYLVDGKLPRIPDISQYVWDLWWVAHQVAHLGNPWFTRYMAAPVGLQLGYDTIMALPGLIMTPVTLLWGPSASFSLLTIAMPGLLCYVMFRAARLWLRTPGAVAAGAFFGLSTMLTWQNWFHLNITAGTIFLPLTLECSVRLLRKPSVRTAIALGVVLGACALTNQESAVMAALIAGPILAWWLIRGLFTDRTWQAARPRLLVLAGAAAVAALVASPQLISMAQQASAGGAATSPASLTGTYTSYAVGLPTMFSPSPRLGHFHIGSYQLAHLASSYLFDQPKEGVPTFGIVLSLLAVAGLALTWRRRSSWWLAFMWLAGAALALGPRLHIGKQIYIPLAFHWNGWRVSPLLPYTWLVHIPGLSQMREADRLAIIGLIGAAVLAGAAVDWLARRKVLWPVIAVIAAAGLLEAGWSGSGSPVMPTARPALNGPIQADHSNSIVLDLRYGLRGGVGVAGWPTPPGALVQATADGHPRAIAYSSWVPEATQDAVNRHAFYRCLLAAQNGHLHACSGAGVTAARSDARKLNIGWVLIWNETRLRASVWYYLKHTGFHRDYRADGVTVWRL
jgi:hypothetical protein